MSDLAFRRHILVQALIVIDFLLSLTPKAKRKIDHTTNKSVLYNYTISDDDVHKSLYYLLQSGVKADDVSRLNGRHIQDQRLHPIYNKGPKESSITAWWTRSCQGIRTGFTGKPKAAHSLNVLRYQQRILPKPRREHRRHAKIKDLDRHRWDH